MTDNEAPVVSATAFDIQTRSFNKGAEFSTSGSIAKIGAALALAQAAITQPVKLAENTYFKANYATLDQVWEACRHALSANGIAVVQAPSYETIDIGSHDKPKRVGVVTLVTMLIHTSGEWIKNTHRALTEQLGPQASQSALTYTRRAALASLCMVTPQDEDDDANAAAGVGAPASDGKAKPAAEDIEDWSAKLKGAKDIDALAAAWGDIPAEFQPKFLKLKDARKKALSALASEPQKEPA